MEHGGRPAAGYVIVAREGTLLDGDLKVWVDLAAAHVSALPAKSKKATTAPVKPRRAIKR